VSLFADSPFSVFSDVEHVIIYNVLYQFEYHFVFVNKKKELRLEFKFWTKQSSIKFYLSFIWTLSIYFYLHACETKIKSVYIYIYVSQDPLTPGVSQKTYTKSQPLNQINPMVHKCFLREVCESFFSLFMGK